MTAAEPSDPRSPATRRARLLAIGLLAVAALAAYRNTFTAPFVLDDADAVTENASIRHLWPLWKAFAPPPGGATVSGRPVANFSFAVNYAISGDAVWSYHVLNLFIHLLAACALLGVVGRTLALPPLRARFGGVQLPLATAVAGLWLLHPLQTEAVTYVCQRTESLMGLFFFLTFYGFIRAVSSPRPWPWRGLAVAACLAAVGTKEVAATVPLLVFLYDRTFVAGTFREAWLRRRWLHLSLAATWVPQALLVAGTGWNRGGTAGFGVGVAPWAYWATQFEAVARYVQLSLWPHPLVFDYGTFWIHSPGEILGPGAGVLALFVATLWAVIRKPGAGFLGAWFFVILAPTSLVPGTNQMIVDHRMYLPLAAVVALAVTGLYAALGRRSLAIWAAAAVALGGLTFARNETYRSRLALWRDTTVKAPGNARAWYNLGTVYSEQGRYAEAAAQDRMALSLTDTKAFAADAPAIHNKLGYDLSRLGRWPEAVAQYEAALRLKPDYARAHLNLARALVRVDRYPEAIRQYEAALRLQAGGAAVESELSDALLHEGRIAEAVAHCRAAVHLAPDWAPGFNNLAYALLLGGHADGSIAAYREAVRLDARYAAAWVGLGYALIQAGRPAQAIDPCTRAVRLKPRFADARNILGIAYAQTGRTAQAIACFEEALKLGHGGADVHNNLGNALAAAGREAEAIAQYREALTRDPNYAPAQRNLGEALRREGREAEAAEHLAAAARLEAEAGREERPAPPPGVPAPAGDNGN